MKRESFWILTDTLQGYSKWILNIRYNAVTSTFRHITDVENHLESVSIVSNKPNPGNRSAPYESHDSVKLSLHTIM